MAGLPNITGAVGAAGSGVFYPGDNTGNCFYSTNDIGYCAYAVQGSGCTALNFEASRCSSIYGSSETVTPLSESVVFCISY